MRDYYETKRMKSASYLYYGLVAAGFTALMAVAGILSVSREADLWITVTSFASAAVWGITSFVSLYIFYINNRAELNSDKLDSSEL
ncbi:MAG: hypothetical protein K2J73_02315 [Oscillospiraceae bacterium]|nr:hypothetical protein [Oscillospiraceae bacterium]